MASVGKRELSLWPPVRGLRVGEGSWRLPDAWRLGLPPGFPPAMAEFVRGEIGRWAPVDAAAGAGVTVELDPALGAEAYRLETGPAGVALRAGDAAGALHGVRTLAQVLEQSGGAVPEVEIEDAPALPVRGYMLDVSRDKVPTMASLRELVDLLATLKYNHLQLYVEHTFAWAGHEVVWGLASPLTSAEVRELGDYAAARGVALAANMNSFGHYERWLQHPEYRHLAECPDGFQRRDGTRSPHGTTLRADEASAKFVEGLYREYLPAFPHSAWFNLGGDEPWELGQGWSAPQVAARGKQAVYCGFIGRLARTALELGKRPLVWADIFLEEGIDRSALPDGLTAVLWGYEANHPFAAQAAALRAAGLPFWIAPGTSAWNSLTGRLENALANISRAAETALATGAGGLLVTDWGDGGHHQFPFVSHAPLLHGAACAWAGRAAPEAELAAALDRLVYRDPTGRTAALVLELGRLVDCVGAPLVNRSTLNQVLFAEGEEALAKACAPLKVAQLAKTGAVLMRLERQIGGLPESLLRRELWLANRLSVHASRRALAHLSRTPVENRLRRRELPRLIAEYEALWLARNRPGGLAESSGRLRRVWASYPA